MTIDPRRVAGARRGNSSIQVQDRLRVVPPPLGCPRNRRGYGAHGPQDPPHLLRPVDLPPGARDEPRGTGRWPLHRRPQGQRLEWRGRRPAQGSSPGDASDTPVYGNGQRFGSKNGRERSDDAFSDPDASWGHRSAVSTRKGGGFYGYKLDMATCARTGPWWRGMCGRRAKWRLPMLRHARRRPQLWLPTQNCRHGQGLRLTTGLRRLRRARNPADHPAPTCEHNEWRFAGADTRRGSKWRCPTGECFPRSRWVKADRLHPLIPRETKRFGKLYADRSAVERAFGRAKH